MTTPPQDPGDQHPQQPGTPGPQQPPPYQSPQSQSPQPPSPQYGTPQQQPPGGQWQSNQQGSGGAEAIDAKGFFSALLDWRFHTLITPKIVSIVYLIGMVLIGLMWLVSLISGFTTEPLVGLFVLIIGPVIGLIYLAFWRMTLEFYFAVVRMSDDIHRSSNAPRL
ncbi:DUF4282 domain-containing protein [Ornithinimicrobium sp. F0845]|uniref:DUF4282 domain-containing protein n=1 Tax=Ornithinimicrobium sp. F0845 TaxID=2926412 RepID=UPI001FF46528|nr:DUF4282 domain-containing protein [Ornithinimicrobium sp. F0845]MCK0113895.1 DUF4282 domain-containing protein [Ornithinimicrobium sp. F0845]